MNAKQELLNVIKDNKIKCAIISFGYDEDDTNVKVLKVNHTERDYQGFLLSLDFNYDSGYGGQELFGTVWLEDGTWLSRGEYDGSEWWIHNVLPPIPESCL